MDETERSEAGGVRAIARRNTGRAWRALGSEYWEGISIEPELRLGIMGGTFDPIHLGHISIAQQVMECLQLGRMVLLPVGDPPHKSREITDKWTRYEMARLAAHGRAGLEAWDLEVRREGVTYTVDTLTQLHDILPGVRIYYVIGADTLLTFNTWRDPGRVLALCELVVAPRHDVDDAAVRDMARSIAERFGYSVNMVALHSPDISSTDIRERIARGFSTQGLLDEKVERYIREHRLYTGR